MKRYSVMPWLFERMAPNWLLADARTVAGAEVRADADFDAFVAAGVEELVQAAANSANAPTAMTGNARALVRGRVVRPVSEVRVRQGVRSSIVVSSHRSRAAQCGCRVGYGACRQGVQAVLGLPLSFVTVDYSVMAARNRLIS